MELDVLLDWIFSLLSCSGLLLVLEETNIISHSNILINTSINIINTFMTIAFIKLHIYIYVTGPHLVGCHRYTR